MQVLDVELTFGEDEANIENRNLDIRVDDKYPLQFSIVNANYKINSFEQNSNAKLQLQSITPTYGNKYYTGCAYNVNLYFKFPLNTFSTSDKTVNLTFDEYNKEMNNYNIEFISTSVIKEQMEEKEQTEQIFKIIVIIIIVILIFRHFDISIISKYKRCVKKCLKEGIIYRDGWKMTSYNVGGPLKLVKTYRFSEAKDGSAKDYLYYRNDKYSPQEIYEIVNGKELLSFQITTYKERVKNEINQKYINSFSLTMALENGMPDKLEYKVIWLRQKIYCLQQSIAKGPERSLKTWHGPYGWQYDSTVADMRNFEKLERKLRDNIMELHNLETQQSDSEKNEWYWYETF